MYYVVYPSNLGNHNATSGTKVTNNNTPIVTARNGNASLAVCSNLHPATGEVTNNVIPNGGVARPTTRLTQKIRPM